MNKKLIPALVSHIYFPSYSFSHFCLFNNNLNRQAFKLTITARVEPLTSRFKSDVQSLQAPIMSACLLFNAFHANCDQRFYLEFSKSHRDAYFQPVNQSVGIVQAVNNVIPC